MADTNGAQAGAGAPTSAARPHIAVAAQYVRDLSFENVAAQNARLRTAAPEISVSVNLDVRKLGEGQFEVVLKIGAKAVSGENKDETVFAVELDYGGVFDIKNVPEEHLRPVLLIECPRILFPFARRIVADVTRDGGYPPLTLDLVDFAAIYQAEIQRRKAEQDAAAAPTN